MGKNLTPAWKQYLSIKEDYIDSILLYRMGDFYEAFDTDAEILSSELQITLTKKEFGKGQVHLLAGIPFHSLDKHLPILVEKGFRIAICEQIGLEPNSQGIIDRKVVRVVSPGTIFEDYLLDNNSNNYLMSAFTEKNNTGISYIDVSTGEIKVTRIDTQSLDSELARIRPSELLSLKSQKINSEYYGKNEFLDSADFNNWVFDPSEYNNVSIIERNEWFDTNLVETKAFIGLINYLYRNMLFNTINFENVEYYKTSEYMFLDPQTRKNLGLFPDKNILNSSFSLFNTLNITKTSMGARLLKNYLGQPLINIKKIKLRQEIISWFYDNENISSKLAGKLEKIFDIERLLSKLVNYRAGPIEVLTLSQSLDMALNVFEYLKSNFLPNKFKKLFINAHEIKYICDLVNNSFEKQYDGKLGDGLLIKKGLSEDLDKYRQSLATSKNILAQMELTERKKTQIKNLRVRYNKIFGYYIEIPKSQLGQVPDYYIRKQTLVNAERFFTEELKNLETDIILSVERIDELERKIFQDICNNIISKVNEISLLANVISELDVHSSLSLIARRNGYVKPKINESLNLKIQKSRHPMVEELIETGKFVPNDVYLNNIDHQIILLTGPNMSGKSTFIRQVGIIVLLAQIGSYVPAENAEIGLVDRIFTRVGLEDDLSAGTSTFMTEMTETATILNEATNKSLIILDEIGRGTSTYDGLAIAMSVAEYIHEESSIGARTLFATHFFEMTTLESRLNRLKNYHVKVLEDQESVVFLHHISKGISARSYGIYVASLAGMPDEVISKSKLLLSALEEKSNPLGLNYTNISTQLPLNLHENNYDEIRNIFNDIDMDNITPLEALIKLSDLKEKFKEKG
mgnify:FL=1